MVYCRICQKQYKRDECYRNGRIACPICHNDVRVGPIGRAAKERLKAKINQFRGTALKPDTQLELQMRGQGNDVSPGPHHKNTRSGI